VNAPRTLPADAEPLILFFGNEQDRADFVKLYQEVRPNVVAVPVVRDSHSLRRLR